MTDQGHDASLERPSVQEIAVAFAGVIAHSSRLIEQVAEDRRREGRWRLFRRFTFMTIAVSVAFVQFIAIGGSSWLRSEPDAPAVAIVEITGEISSHGKVSADTLVPLIERACRSQNVRALVLDIDSPGGAPAEAERIARATDLCHTAGRDKRVVAYIENIGASAAYLVAVNADEIVASRFALVGSIGAIMTSYDAQDALAKLGIEGRIYASGPLKAMGAITQHDTPAQARTAQAIVEDAGRLFREEVEAHRGKKLHSDPELYSGRVWTADTALNLGLIDRVEVIDHLLQSDFGKLVIQRVEPHRPIAETLGLNSFVQSVADRLIYAASSTPQIH